MNMSREVVIVSAARTPIGSFQGALAGVQATELGSIAIKAALERASVSGADVNEVLMGMVLPAGVGQAPARQASKGAGIPDSVGALTINKVCGSGLKAVMLAAQAIRSGDGEVFVAGGMESMSNVPYLLPGARDGYRMFNKSVVDGMVHDGLWDPYNDYHMGNAGDLCGRECGISRERQDEFAAHSYRLAQNAVTEGLFAKEIVPVAVPQRKGDPIIVDKDEEPFRGNIAKLPSLRAAFGKDGSVTAGNAPSINDGAAALVVMSREQADARGLKPLATIKGYAGYAQAPEWFTTAPAGAMQALLDKTGLSVGDVDLWEINEAFAVVALANQDKLGIASDRINVRGGAVALGHPIGCSGARVLVTLLYALEALGKQRGVASLCLGGGEAVALMVER
ncbi:3-ketoacyl-CoA thiolase [Enhygromyxa salina]|uniref:3-ketoacyl-CoA thiolase n=2 Tax=Enhygromyxa salina TaxID=215803 RepID=A0A0C2CYQ7_9BACT|nr:3-ketoacyl-CoA thiolase [Enhygromyxa salina]